MLLLRVGVLTESKMTDLRRYQQDLEATRQEVRNLTVMAMRPHLSPADVDLIRNLEQQARAEVMLRQKHLASIKNKLAK